MKAHIVFAHPARGSFTRAMLDVIVKELRELEYDVSVADLYALSFDPVLSERDFGFDEGDHFIIGLEQRRAFAERRLPSDVMLEIGHVLAADLLVLVFPVFWFGTPAILKGWIERVFISGVFYGGRRIYDGGGLKGKRAFVAMSMGGRAHMFGDGAIHGELISGMMRHLFQGTLAYVGLDVHEPFVAHHVPYVSEAARAAMLHELGQAVKGLPSRPLLSRPRLEDFDHEFAPRRVHDQR